jgi:hypothetical protein
LSKRKINYFSSPKDQKELAQGRFFAIVNSMKAINKISPAEYRELLVALAKRGSVAATLHTRTEPDMRKTNNPFWGNAFKVSSVSVMFGTDYEKAVNRRMAKEGAKGEFKAESTWYDVSPEAATLAIHKRTGAEYTRAHVNTHTKPLVTFETADGDILSKDDLKPWLRESKESAKQAKHGLRGKKQAKPRTWKPESVVGIAVDGELYLIER